MALYSYKAINAQGQVSRGVQEAASVTALEFQLQRGGLDLIRAKTGGRAFLFGERKISRAHLITFFFNLNQLFRAGVPLLEGLSDLRDSMDERRFRGILSRTVEAIESGKTLSQAMAQHPQAFGPITVSLTHAGEESGCLADIFGQLTESLKWQDELAAQTRNMMIYPAFVGVMVLGITFFLMTYLMPQLSGFLKGMAHDLPLQTRMLLAISDVFANYWYVTPALPVVLFAAIRLALKHDPGLQHLLDSLKLRLWPVGPILHKIILARFAHTFAMMYGSGMSILDCLAHSRDLAGNQVIARNLEQVMQEIAAGKNLTQSFMHTGIFPPLVLRMLKVGESTGQLDAALLNVAYFYDRDVKDAIKRMQALLEPAMTVVLGVLLGWVMLSVLSPIYDVISKVGV